MSRLELRHPLGTTAIRVGTAVLEEAAGELRQRLAGRTVFLVSSRPVLDLHGDKLLRLQSAASPWRLLEVADGEAAKSVAGVEALWRAMLDAGGKRDSAVVGFGGGSVGDLAGFAAATFLRGVELVLLPTTLLAQVDAAIGGKTGVNLPAAKNSVGAFHHPSMVLCDTGLLATLEPGEIRSGLFEVVKMALLLDAKLFLRVEQDLEALLGGDARALEPVVAAAARAKIGVVESDPREGDRRRLLNFGHTLGHALEAAAGYGSLRHGEAVGYGMLFATRLALARGLDPAVGERLRRLVRRLDLPRLADLEVESLLSHMDRDKKALEGGLAWVLPTALGEGRVVNDVTAQEVAERLGEFLRSPLS